MIDNVKILVNRILAFTLLLAFASAAQAQLQIEIIDGNPAALPTAVVPFQWLEAVLLEERAPRSICLRDPMRTLRLPMILY